MPTLVTTGFNRKKPNQMMISLDDRECLDDDNLFFSDDSYDTEGEREDGQEEVSVSDEKENATQTSTSNLRLRVVVNGEEISESDDSVGEVRRPLQPVLGRRSAKRVSPTTSLSNRVKRTKNNTEKPPKKKKKGKLTLSLKPKASLKPPPKIQPKKTKTSKEQNDLPLPDGDFQAWLVFGDNGGYSVAKEEWTRIRAWVSLKRSKKDFVAEAVTFHRLILSLKRDLALESARDSWERVLPPKSAQNFPVCCLFLMICTPMVPDTKIVDIFEPIFRNNHVTADWVLEQREEGMRELLRPLGRQANSSKFVIASMTELQKRGGVLPRDYRVLKQFPGVGPKVALVTCQEVYGNAQGVPHDIHMCREFTALGWVPPSDESSLVGFLSKKEAYNYEMCRASMEGWFPRDLWAEMNQTWAGLGQLLNDNKHKQTMAAYIDNKVSNFDSPWRVVDKEKFMLLLEVYRNK